MEAYTTFTFSTREDFEECKDELNLDLKSIDIPLSKKSEKQEIKIFVKTKYLVSKCTVTIKTKGGRDVKIQVASAYVRKL